VYQYLGIDDVSDIHSKCWSRII